MISTLVKQQSQGYAALICDAGVPVMGIDADGNYKFLNLTTEGFPSNNIPLTTTSFALTPIAVTVNSNPLAVLMAAGTIIFNAPIFVIITAGLYNIDPFVSYMANNGLAGSLNILLMRQSPASALNTYITTLTPPVQAVLTQANTLTGNAGFYPNNTMMAMGGTDGAKTLYMATGGNKQIYLTAGSYNMVGIVATASTIGGTQSANIGFNNFSKVM